MDDTHDERPAELLARLRVEPLDEVTRARLVRTALDAAPAQPDGVERRHRPVRWLAAAAVIVAAVAVGVSVVVRNSDAPQTTASAPAADRSLDKGANDELATGAAAPQGTLAPASSSLDVQVAVPSIGKLGEVGRSSALRAAVNAAKTHGRFTATCPTPNVGTGGVLISGGTGTVDGEPASVYVIEVPDAGKVAVAVVDAECRTALAVPF